MSICYIISTCEKYLDTRVKYQLQSFLKHVDQKDIYYLTAKPNLAERQFGWNCLDDPYNITWKYINFIYNMNIPEYDWYAFIDDDTFVFKNRLEKLLQNYDCNECYYIGKELDHIKRNFGLYMSGGAGYLISKKLYFLIDSYVKQRGPNSSFKHWCDDLCIGLWIQEIAKQHKLNQIDNNNFHTELHKNDFEIKDAITFHKVMTKEQYDFYTSIFEKELNENNNEKTVFTLVTDLKYFDKAKRTIIDLRSRGKWGGEIVLVTIDFDLPSNFKDFYNIIETKFNKIDKTNLLNKIGQSGFIDTTDKREVNKLNQWEKLHIFDDYFKRWQRVVFLDAGLRVLDDVTYLLELEYKGKILAPKDGKINENQAFKCQLSYDKPELIDNLKSEFEENILDENYMLNCIWVYDTNILNVCDKEQLIEAMNKYTFCKTNEMGVMNLMFHFKYNLWEQFPVKASNGKILFDWCELNQSYPTSWRDYCFIKYSVSIKFEDT